MLYVFVIAELNFDSENIRVLRITFIQKISLNRLVQNAEVCYFNLMGLHKCSCANKKMVYSWYFGGQEYDTVHSTSKAE